MEGRKRCTLLGTCVIEKAPQIAVKHYSGKPWMRQDVADRFEACPLSFGLQAFMSEKRGLRS